MSSNLLRNRLIASLQDVYELEAFRALAELLQGESLILQYLWGHQDEAVYPSDLSRELRLSRSRITGALSSLRRKGLLTMHHSQEDRRRIQVAITPEGLSLIGARMRHMEQYFDRMIAGLGDRDTQSLISLIDKCVEVMDQ